MAPDAGLQWGWAEAPVEGTCAGARDGGRAQSRGKARVRWASGWPSPVPRHDMCAWWFAAVLVTTNASLNASR
eukprot:2650558-Alexandrium_andersonii.AAC.1